MFRYLPDLSCIRMVTSRPGRAESLAERTFLIYGSTLWHKPTTNGILFGADRIKCPDGSSAKAGTQGKALKHHKIMSDQKNPTNQGTKTNQDPQSQQHKPQAGTHAGHDAAHTKATEKPQDKNATDRMGNDPSHTKATEKPHDKNTKEPGRESKPDVKAQQK